MTVTPVRIAKYSISSFSSKTLFKFLTRGQKWIVGLTCCAIYAAFGRLRLAYDFPLCCRCGRVRGVARGVSTSAGFRFVCYCTDCQAFARFLGRPDVLDAAGGTDIFQMPPARVKFTAGTDAVSSLRFSSKVLRWYTDCCRTPIANAATSSRFPIVALINSFIDHEAMSHSRDEVLGPPLCRIYERSAIGPPPPNAPVSPSLGAFARRASRMFDWWCRGLAQPNPFFDDRSNAPISAPRAITPSERATLEQGSA
jgi:hypothetical protein